MADGVDPPAGEYEVDVTTLIRLLRASDYLRNGVIHSIEESGLFSPPLSYRGRVKTEEGVVSKIARKRIKDAGYTLESVQDLLGVRFITLLRMDIAKVANDLLSMIAQQTSSESRSLGKVELIEFKQFVATTGAMLDQDTGSPIDPLTDSLRPLLEVNFGSTFPVKLIVEPRPQYSGVHLIVAHTVSVDKAQPVKVHVEYQIRSVFEEAWGEIDHKLFYEDDRDGKISGEKRRLALDKHLRILKAMLDNAANYAELLWYMDVGEEDRQPAVKANLDDVGYLVGLTHRLHPVSPIFERFIELYRKKDRIDKSTGNKADSYRGLAESFERLAKEFPRELSGKKFTDKDYVIIKTVSYLVLMEHALCRLLTGSSAQIRRAIDIYDLAINGRPFDYVYDSFNHYPTAWFRLAECHGALVELVESIEDKERHTRLADDFYVEARKALNALPQRSELLISPNQKSYLEQNVERLRGFVHWRISNIRRAISGKVTSQDVDDIHCAWMIVKPKIESLEKITNSGDLNLINSALYFALDGLQNANDEGESHREFPSLSEFERLLNILQVGVTDIGPATENVWHTIMRSLVFIQRPGDAQRAAEIILDIRENMPIQEMSPYVAEVHEYIGKDAWKVFKGR
ncbi:MAG: hypothetical protein BVN33_06835 [Proteobacteria bacterium ST_bin13]|nr:MAG: hypothetical protein BVN33_06835 [Proteobacteria bacterium ST_bin13]